MIQTQEWLGFRRLLIVPAGTDGASVQLDIFGDGEIGKAYKGKYRADALLYSLWVDEGERGKGRARTLVQTAEMHARVYGCRTVALEYDSREAPGWVRKWYGRLGYNEKVFGRYYSLMVKQLQTQKEQ